MPALFIACVVRRAELAMPPKNKIIALDQFLAASVAYTGLRKFAAVSKECHDSRRPNQN